MGHIRIYLGFSVVLIAISVIAGCGGSKPEAPKQASQGGMVGAMAKMGNLATDPLAQMSFEFEGNPPKEEIQEKVDKVLMMYGMDASNPNRSTAGRTLVALRKEHGHSEMAILDKMLSTPAEGKFEDAAAKIAAAM